MLIGEYEGKIAEKNRIALPLKFRNELSGSLIISRGYEDCLIILDEERWIKLVKGIEVKPFLNRSVRETKRFILGGASEIDLDLQGRFIIPSTLKKYARLEKEIVFIGIGDWVEIWDLTTWNVKLESLKNNAAEIADRLA